MSAPGLKSPYICWYQTQHTYIARNLVYKSSWPIFQSSNHLYIWNTEISFHIPAAYPTADIIRVYIAHPTTLAS